MSGGHFQIQTFKAIDEMLQITFVNKNDKKILMSCYKILKSLSYCGIATSQMLDILCYLWKGHYFCRLYFLENQISHTISQTSWKSNYPQSLDITNLQFLINREPISQHFMVFSKEYPKSVYQIHVRVQICHNPFSVTSFLCLYQ